jgi:hypothetical protein
MTTMPEEAKAMLTHDQLYEVQLDTGKVTLARYRESLVELGGELDGKPGFDLGYGRCDLAEVVEYREISEEEATERYGYNDQETNLQRP